MTPEIQVRTNPMSTIIAFLLFALNIYSIILIIRAFMGWFPELDHSNPIVRLLHDLTEPVLAPIRRAVPPMGGMDWSIVIALVAINIITLVLPR
jgi:YggT family protein